MLNFLYNKAFQFFDLNFENFFISVCLFLGYSIYLIFILKNNLLTNDLKPIHLDNS